MNKRAIRTCLIKDVRDYARVHTLNTEAPDGFSFRDLEYIGVRYGVVANVYFDSNQTCVANYRYCGKGGENQELICIVEKRDRESTICITTWKSVYIYELGEPVRKINRLFKEEVG